MLVVRDGDPGGVERQIGAVAVSESLLEAQSSIRCPVAVIHGDADQIFGIDHAEETARRIPGASLHLIEGMGHEMPKEAWPDFFETIVRVAGGRK